LSLPKNKALLRSAATLPPFMEPQANRSVDGEPRANRAVDGGNDQPRPSANAAAMGLLMFAFRPRNAALSVAVLLTLAIAAYTISHPEHVALTAAPLIVFGFLSMVGLRDLTQTRHAILRNYPLAAHLRFLFEEIRPEMRQYFFEGEKDGAPFSRDKRAIVYQRAKSALDKRPFGTQYEVYQDSFEWLTHSIAPTSASLVPLRTQIGGGSCKQPYSASLLNISGMSFGALSANAISSMNLGAKRGGFAHTTGEGSVSRYHLQGGDLVWQIGSGYFGCRNADGLFCPERFAQTAALDQIRMIEIKLSKAPNPAMAACFQKKRSASKSRRHAAYRWIATAYRRPATAPSRPPSP